jgi:hypothetical protein
VAVHTVWRYPQNQILLQEARLRHTNESFQYEVSKSQSATILRIEPQVPTSYVSHSNSIYARSRRGIPFGMYHTSHVYLWLRLGAREWDAETYVRYCWDLELQATPILKLDSEM